MSSLSTVASSLGIPAGRENVPDSAVLETGLLWIRREVLAK
jgi:hypothetical protein